MIELADARLSAWESFYVIVGSSGGALIGLQFVVMALIPDTRKRATAGEIDAFGTPTVVHLGSALLVSALMSAPWRDLAGPSVALAIAGLAGIGYGLIVIHRARRQTGYTPVWDDWLWHVVLPCTGYAALGAAALSLRNAPHPALFVIAGAALGLLLIGIRNAWDTVKYIVVSESRGRRGGHE